MNTINPFKSNELTIMTNATTFVLDGLLMNMIQSYSNRFQEAYDLIENISTNNISNVNDIKLGKFYTYQQDIKQIVLEPIKIMKTFILFNVYRFETKFINGKIVSVCHKEDEQRRYNRSSNNNLLRRVYKHTNDTERVVIRFCEYNLLKDIKRHNLNFHDANLYKSQKKYKYDYICWLKVYNEYDPTREDLQEISLPSMIYNYNWLFFGSYKYNQYEEEIINYNVKIRLMEEIQTYLNVDLSKVIKLYKHDNMFNQKRKFDLKVLHEL